MGAIGLDKVGLVAPVAAVAVRPDFDPEIHTRTSGATGQPLRENILYRDVDGRPKYGDKAVLNGPHFQATFAPGRDGTPIFAVQFSGCAIAANNVAPLDRDGLMEALRVVRDGLMEAGCAVDLESSLTLCRMDATRNNAMEEPTAGYWPLLAAGGLRKTTRKSDFGGTGFIVGPKSKVWESAGYDKEQELISKGYESTLCEPNTLRIEARALRAAMVRRMFGVSTVRDLLSNWGNVRAGFVENVSANVIKLDVQKSMSTALSPQSLEDAAAFEMRQLQEEYGANWWRLSGSLLRDSYWVNRYGLSAAVGAVGKVLGNDSDSAKKHVRRIHQSLERVAHSHVLQERAPSGRKNSELYREFKSKLLAA